MRLRQRHHRHTDIHRKIERERYRDLNERERERKKDRILMSSLNTYTRVCSPNIVLGIKRVVDTIPLPFQ